MTFKLEKVIIARVLMFPFNQGMVSPVALYTKCCRAFGVQEKNLNRFPRQSTDVFRKYARYSFFSGKEASSFCLLDFTDLNAVELWNSIIEAERLNWISNYDSAHYLITQYTIAEQLEIANELNTAAKKSKTFNLSYLSNLAAPDNANSSSSLPELF